MNMYRQFDPLSMLIGRKLIKRDAIFEKGLLSEITHCTD